MKRLLTLLLALTLCFSLFACAPQFDEPDYDDDDEETEMAAPLETSPATEAPAVEATEPAEPDGDDLDALLAEADPEVAAAVDEILQGDWEYTDENGFYYEFNFDDGDFWVKLTVSTSAMENYGTYEVRKGAVLVNYQTGKRAILRYSYEDGELFLSIPEGID